MNDDMKAEICRMDFREMMKEAFAQAGGSPPNEAMSLGEVINSAAQNGIRMVYMPEKHLTSVEVSWKKPGYIRMNPSVLSDET
jgi:hypothetical protein